MNFMIGGEPQYLNNLEARYQERPPLPPRGPEETDMRTQHDGHDISRAWVNPFRFLGIDPKDYPHVKYDPTLRRLRASHYRIRSASGDGTLTHKVWAMQDALFPVLAWMACVKGREDEVITGYTIGPARVAAINGVPVTLNSGGTYPGTLCHIGLPLIVHYEQDTTS